MGDLITQRAGDRALVVHAPRPKFARIHVKAQAYVEAETHAVTLAAPGMRGAEALHHRVAGDGPKRHKVDRLHETVGAFRRAAQRIG